MLWHILVNNSRWEVLLECLLELRISLLTVQSEWVASDYENLKVFDFVWNIPQIILTLDKIVTDVEFLEQVEVIIFVEHLTVKSNKFVSWKV